MVSFQAHDVIIIVLDCKINRRYDTSGTLVVENENEHAREKHLHKDST